MTTTAERALRAMSGPVPMRIEQTGTRIVLDGNASHPGGELSLLFDDFNKEIRIVRRMPEFDDAGEVIDCVTTTQRVSIADFVRKVCELEGVEYKGEEPPNQGPSGPRMLLETS